MFKQLDNSVPSADSIKKTVLSDFIPPVQVHGTKRCSFIIIIILTCFLCYVALLQ